jgi:ssDNA thymidine ADP-ribosyltransferase, DarT
MPIGIRQALDCQLAGMSEIKRWRLEELEVACHPGTKVGAYIPFYFRLRSVMLYLLYQGNTGMPEPDIRRFWMIWTGSIS